MIDWVPFFTQDGSVGLYSRLDKDIYHSVFGALSEAYEKFILPADFNNYFKNNNEIKILDLCYGIGYNTKSFLNYFFQNFDFLTGYNDTICTDNILRKVYNDTVHTNNIFRNNLSKNTLLKMKNYKIKIDAVDKNKTLMKLSPFFKMNNKILKNYSTGISDIDKYLKLRNKNLNQNKNNCDYKNNYNYFYNLFPEVNMIILHNLYKSYNTAYFDTDIIDVLSNENYKIFLDADVSRFMAFYFSKVYNLSSEHIKSTFLHNIYYEYISKSYKNTLKVLQNNEISISYISDDARKFLLSENNLYDFIFLDAFSPNKCPNLWTYEFFNLLYNHLSDNGKILTYSNSSAVRNAMLKNNFYIAKIFNKHENKFTGTIAVKNPNLIESNFTDYDLGLLNTKAGIMYRDETLSADNEAILSLREYDVRHSDLISTTQFKKGVLNEI